MRKEKQNEKKPKILFIKDTKIWHSHRNSTSIEFRKSYLSNLPYDMYIKFNAQLCIASTEIFEGKKKIIILCLPRIIDGKMERRHILKIPI